MKSHPVKRLPRSPKLCAAYPTCIPRMAEGSGWRKSTVGALAGAMCISQSLVI